MKLGMFFPVLFLLGCGTSEYVEAYAPPQDAGTHLPESGLCCQIVNNIEDSGPWYNARYSCLPDDAGLQPFNPPWICGVNEAGNCGGDSGVECLTCDMPSCVTGMDCLGANGTGIVLPCDQQDW